MLTSTMTQFHGWKLYFHESKEDESNVANTRKPSEGINAHQRCARIVSADRADSSVDKLLTCSLLMIR